MQKKTQKLRMEISNTSLESGFTAYTSISKESIIILHSSTQPLTHEHVKFNKCNNDGFPKIKNCIQS